MAKFPEITIYETSDENASFLISALRGPALDMVQKTSNRKLKDYGLLVAALEVRFGDQHKQQLYRAPLMNRNQRSNDQYTELIKN